MNVAADDEPLFVTVGELPAASAVAEPAAIVAAAPVGPLEDELMRTDAPRAGENLRGIYDCP